jgi:EAL domain-containing protein (putative c-di-GMP-specific phosphodiesterase class I)
VFAASSDTPSGAENHLGSAWAGVALLSLHPEQELDGIAAGLAASGACALVLIEARPLERIERRYGGEAYRRSIEGLKSLARELLQETAPEEEILVTEERSRGDIVALIFASRSRGEFYGTWLPELARVLGRELLLKGRRAVYPYYKTALELPIGVAVVLHNPTVEPERLILQAVEEARRDAALEEGLRARETSRQLLDMILSGNLTVRYEAIVDINSAQVLGYEALSRGPEGTDFNTARELFRRAESAGLLYELDCLCRKKALQRASQLPDDSVLFLNCLPTAIGDPNLRDDGLRKMLEVFDLRPSDLVLEISESESIDNFGVFREVSDSCREVGIRIAIDDAGTGYASMEAIMEIAPDFIKTDMALVRGIDADPARQAVVRAINALAAGIGAQVIAEGIETDRELRVLRELGVRYGQGFYFGAALRTR